MIDLLEIPDFFGPSTLAAVLGEVERAAGAAASVLGAMGGGTVQSQVRRTTRLAPPQEVRDTVRQRLMALKPEIERHFGVTLGECEEPQFLRYETGDFFVPHQDGNTPMVWDDSRFRRISAVMFLNPRSDAPAEGRYGGGELVFHDRDPAQPRVAARAAPGSLVTFPAETTHEVTPITHGVRYTIATWFRCPA